MQAELDDIEGQTYPHHWPVLRQVYLDLRLAKLWKDIQVKRVESLKLSVLMAAEPNNQQQQLVIVPVHYEDALSVTRISDMFKGLEADGSGSLEKITLAIVSQDSTIVYYHICPGLSQG